MNQAVPFLSIKDACRVTGLSQHYLRYGCRDGSVPHVKCGSKYMINVPELMKRLTECGFKDAMEASS